MKPTSWAILVAGYALNACHAAILSIEWNPSTSTVPHLATVGVGGTATADVITLLIPTETLSTVAFEFNNEPRLFSTGNISTSVTDWATLATPGMLGGVGVNVAAASADPLNTSLVGPGAFTLASFDLLVASGDDEDVVQIMFGDYQGELPRPLLLGQDGSSYRFGPRYAGPGGAVGDYPGYYAFGIGGPPCPPGKCFPSGQPLLLHIPEPAAFVLLIIGGVVLLRRCQANVGGADDG